MRFLIPFVFGGLTAGSAFFGWLLFRQPDRPEPPSPTLLDADRLRAELHQETAARARAERERDLWTVYAGIWRHRLMELGQPQSWPGPTVSTIYLPPRAIYVPPPEQLGIRPDEPEPIPPPAVPFPVRPE